MITAHRADGPHRWLDGYLVLLGLLTLVYGIYTAHSSRSWSISDWLINYQGGFTRRGLPGELFFLVSRATDVPAVALVILTCFVLYAVLLLSVRSLAARCSWDIWAVAVLVSPATLAFPILDLTAGFRKEVIYLASLALLLVLLRRGCLADRETSLYLAVVIVAGTLAHEPLICFSPYLLAALLISSYRWGRALRIVTLPLLLGLGAAYASSTHLGGLATAQAICGSLGYSLRPPGREICAGGAIAYLTHTRMMARQETLAVIASKQYLRMYPALAVLALLPILAGAWKLARTGVAEKIQVLAGLALVAMAGSSVLFLYAEDWGRWIYIHVLSLGLLLLFLDGEQSHAEAAPRSGRGRFGVACMVAIYASCWSLPCAGKAAEYAQDAGYAGLVRHVLAHRHRGAPGAGLAMR